jgi:hypothetical protein
VDPGVSLVQEPIELTVLKAKAYVDALEDFPIVSYNSLQNIASLYQILVHFAFDAEATEGAIDALSRQMSSFRYLDQTVSLELPEIPGYARDAWLGGRYVWTTSVSDAKQGWEFIYNKLLQALKVRSKSAKCHGKVTADDGTTVQCTFRMEEKALDAATSFLEKAYVYGLEPNAYVMWDFVPYSFVIDWFLPIGDSLDAYTKASHFCPMYYTYKNEFDIYTMCYSVSYVADTDIGPIKFYTRWYESQPPKVEPGYFVLGSQSVSDVTACWRLVDAICLIL